MRKKPRCPESTRMRACFTYSKGNRAANVVHSPHQPSHVRAERCSHGHLPRSIENNSHPQTQLYKSASEHRGMDTKSDSLVIICSTASVLHLCQVLCIDFGFYYLKWIFHLQGCADLRLLHLRCWSWKMVAQPARQITEQAGDTPPRMPAVNSLFSFKKL